MNETENLTNISSTLNYEKIETYKYVLNDAIQQIINTWENIRDTDISQIQKSWLGPAGSLYIERVLENEEMITALEQLGELLTETYEKSASKYYNTINKKE